MVNTSSQINDNTWYLAGNIPDTFTFRGGLEAQQRLDRFSQCEGLDQLINAFRRQKEPEATDHEMRPRRPGLFLVQLRGHDALFLQQHVPDTQLLDRVDIGLAMTDAKIGQPERWFQMREIRVFDGVHRDRRNDAFATQA